MREQLNFYIDGKWVAPAVPHDLAVIDPSTEEQCAVISLGSQADTDAAVAAATRAFEDWSRTDPADRLALVKRIHDALKQAMEMPNHVEVLGKYDQALMYMGPAQYTKFAQDTYQKEKVLVEKLGLAKPS